MATAMALALLVLAVDVRKLIAKHVVDGTHLARCKLLLGKKLKNQVNASNIRKWYAVHNENISLWIWCSIINHDFCGTPILGNLQISPNHSESSAGGIFHASHQDPKVTWCLTEETILSGSSFASRFHLLSPSFSKVGRAQWHNPLKIGCFIMCFSHGFLLHKV